MPRPGRERGRRDRQRRRRRRAGDVKRNESVWLGEDLTGQHQRSRNEREERLVLHGPHSWLSTTHVRHTATVPIAWFVLRSRCHGFVATCRRSAVQKRSRKNGSERVNAWSRPACDWCRSTYPVDRSALQDYRCLQVRTSRGCSMIGAAATDVPSIACCRSSTPNCARIAARQLRREARGAHAPANRARPRGVLADDPTAQRRLARIARISSASRPK